MHNASEFRIDALLQLMGQITNDNERVFIELETIHGITSMHPKTNHSHLTERISQFDC